MKVEVSIEPEYTVRLTRRDAEDFVFLADNEPYIREKFSGINVSSVPLQALRMMGTELKKLGVR